MIRAALFDFGGVIVGRPLRGLRSTYERDHDLPDGFLRRVNATDPDTNAWARLERGEVDVDGFGPLFEAEAAALGHPVDGGQVLGLLAGAAGPSGLRPAMVEAVRRCGEHLTTGLLTNNFVTGGGEGMQTGHVRRGAGAVRRGRRVEPGRRAQARSPLLRDGVRQPLGIEPTEAVFLDDLGINLKPARAMGMTTIKVGDPTVAIAELEQVVGFALA